MHMCASVWVCMHGHECSNACGHMNMYTRGVMCMYGFVYVCVCVCVCVCLCVWCVNIGLCTKVQCVCAYGNMYMSVVFCVCVCVHVCAYGNMDMSVVFCVCVWCVHMRAQRLLGVGRWVCGCVGGV